MSMACLLSDLALDETRSETGFSVGRLPRLVRNDSKSGSLEYIIRLSVIDIFFFGRCCIYNSDVQFGRSAGHGFVVRHRLHFEVVHSVRISGGRF